MSNITFTNDAVKINAEKLVIEMENADVLDQLKTWVNNHYSPVKCGWTALRSMGNYDDCFEDGAESGMSWAAYELGEILGLDLVKPEEPEYE